MRSAARPSRGKINTFRGCGAFLIVACIYKRRVPHVAEQRRFASRERPPREVFLTMFYVTHSKIDAVNDLGHEAEL